MCAYLRVPDDVQVLHCQFDDTLATLRNHVVRERLESYGVRFRPRPSDWPVRLLSWSVFNAGRVFDWRGPDDYWNLVRPVLDWNNPHG